MFSWLWSEPRPKHHHKKRNSQFLNYDNYDDPEYYKKLFKNNEDKDQSLTNNYENYLENENKAVD